MKSRVLAAIAALLLGTALVCAYLAYHADANVRTMQADFDRYSKLKKPQDAPELEEMHRIGIRNQSEQRTLTCTLAAGFFTVGLVAVFLARRARR